MRVAIIPARGGSKRIPRKNIRPFHGKPIIAYSIETAKASRLFDAVYVSTENAEIADIALDCGAIVIHRPAALAEIGAPDCGTQEVTRHALMALQITDGEACCIYPTAPMMTVRDLTMAQEICAGSLIGFVYTDGWFYFGRPRDFLNRVSLDVGTRIVPPGDRWIDINVESDWQLAEEMYAALHGEIAHG